MSGRGHDQPVLIDSISTEQFETDYSLLSVTQEWQERPDALVLATSAPGALGMVCGSRFANLQVTVERWSGRPGDGGEWEDIDEIPFEPLFEAGPLYVRGFDEPGVAGPALDVSDLGRSTARVCAAGRRFADRVGELDQTTERWLVQLWPDDNAATGLIGGSPRILKTALEAPPTFEDLDAQPGPADPYYHAFPAKWDVVHLVRWSPGQVLVSTPSAVARRLAVSVDHVIGAIVAVVRHKLAACSADPRTLGPDDHFELRR